MPESERALRSSDIVEFLRCTAGTVHKFSRSAKNTVSRKIPCIIQLDSPTSYRTEYEWVGCTRPLSSERGAYLVRLFLSIPSSTSAPAEAAQRPTATIWTVHPTENEAARRRPPCSTLACQEFRPHRCEHHATDTAPLRPRLRYRQE